MINLDFLCIECAQQIVGTSSNANNKNLKDLENNLRKALGILQENGVYAMFLWLKGKDAETMNHIIEMLNKDDLKNYFLSESKFFSHEFNKFTQNLADVVKNLDKLLFMKKLIERTLIYALYHARAGD